MRNMTKVIELKRCVGIKIERLYIRRRRTRSFRIVGGPVRSRRPMAVAATDPASTKVSPVA